MKNPPVLKNLFSLAILLIFSACSAGTKTPTVNPTEGVQMLAGIYTTTISAEDVSKMESLDPNLAANQGVWKITFTDEGKFNAEKDGQFMAGGEFTVKGNQIELYVKQVCTDCVCQEDIGHFYWVQKDDRLGFTKIAGGCEAMRLLLTAHSITRQP